jgi:hypothetical protein
MNFKFGTTTVSSSDAKFQDFLAAAHGKDRPLCLCVVPGIEMYIAKVGGKFYIKRMPNTGTRHAAACESYEPPAELSGLGQVMGSAIQEDVEEGVTTLKFDFSLSKGGSRSAPIASDAEADSVKSDGTKLTLRALLHFLWEEAGFHKWSPAMDGKRNWGVIRRYLLQAAENKTAKGGGLSDLLYIPEPFNLDRKEEIAGRRLQLLSKVATPQKGQRKLLMLVGEVKEFGPSRYGHKMVIKQVPDCHFMLNEDIYKRLHKRFGTEMGLWNSLEDSHMMVIGTFSVSDAGVPSIEEAALMVTTENWIPVENAADKTFIDLVTKAKRRFTKGLRYNLPSTRPLASAVLQDAADGATACYVIPMSATDEYLAALEELRGESELNDWTWAVSEPMPNLP